MDSQPTSRVSAEMSRSEKLGTVLGAVRRNAGIFRAALSG
jgi:hypothetical protein